jgi:phosphohistidine phosphatase SixA
MRHGHDCIVASVKRAALVLSLLVVALAAARTACAQEAIYIVRHAERLDQSPDPPLSSDGIARANRLREILHSAGITHVFTSTLRRTIDTARPTADLLHLVATPLQVATGPAVADALATLAPHDRALVVGHSNTVPELLRALKVATPITIEDSEYDNLFVVVPLKDAPPLLLRLKY